MNQQPKGLHSAHKPTYLPFSNDILPDEISETKSKHILVKTFEQTGIYTPVKPTGFHTHTVEGTNK